MAVILLSLVTAVAYAQTNTFPSTGNAGVGTMTPVNKLTVQTATNNTGIVHTDGTIRVGTYVGGSAGWLGTVSNHPLYFYTNNGGSQIALLTNGRVGIGTTSPAGKLDVRGDDAYIQGLRAGTGSGNDSSSTCFGKYTLEIAGGSRNTAIGYMCLRKNTSGLANTAVGSKSLTANTSGIYNTAMGESSLENNLAGSANTAIGWQSMWRNIRGELNTAIGQYSLSGNDLGSYNIAVGANALIDNIAGFYNTAIGYRANVNNTNLTNTTTVGYFALATASNQARIGNSSVTSIGGYVNWTNISDGRVKRNIKENVPGVDFIKLLKPVTYNLQLDEIDKLNHASAEKAAGENDKSVMEGRAEKEKIIYTGFIAQDVEKAAKTLGFNFSGVDAPKDKDGLYGIRYAEFVVPLVKAVQELSAENEKLKAEISEIKAMLKMKNTVVIATAASLEQNAPNPSNGLTTIKYSLPAKYNSASIVVTDNVGKKMKIINLSGNGKGSILLNTNAMSTGSYQYSLNVDNNLVETKQLLIAK